jgi:hypothetical protein
MLLECMNIHLVKVVIWGRVSKQVTNGSKTAVMDVVGFLCVSLGSCTVQLHDSLGSKRACPCSEAGFSTQNGDRAWGVYFQRAAFCCVFSVSKRTQCKRYLQRNVSCLRWEVFVTQSGSQLGGKRFTDDEVVETEVQKWLRQQWKNFSAAGFDALVNDGTSVSMLVEDMSRNKYFARCGYYIFYILFLFVTSFLTHTPKIKQ